LKTGQTLQIRAANKKRPVIRLSDRPDQFSVSGGDGSYLTLDGLLISGRGLQIEGDIAGVIIRHSTLYRAGRLSLIASRVSWKSQVSILPTRIRALPSNIASSAPFKLISMK
ncbi:hypothetical protein, partial [Methylicorpusculum sp.]|uniref:hypothetical protein n=1 Tax=Methylicorpusculum sp. TaxID=2713644 RepID=UPI002ABBB790